MNSNADLIPVGHGPQHQTVAPIQAITKPMPYVKVDNTKYYICTVPAGSFIRNDGKRIPFLFGVCETDNKYDIEHLETELSHGNIYLRRANEDEIREYKMRRDPRGTIEAEVIDRVKNDPSVRAELEDKIRKELLEQAAANDGVIPTKKEEVKSNVVDDSSKLTGVDALKAAASVRAGNATIKEINTAGETSNKPLINPVGSDKVKDGAAGN